MYHQLLVSDSRKHSTLYVSICRINSFVQFIADYHEFITDGFHFSKTLNLSVIAVLVCLNTWFITYPFSYAIIISNYSEFYVPMFYNNIFNHFLSLFLIIIYFIRLILNIFVIFWVGWHWVNLVLRTLFGLLYHPRMITVDNGW